MAQRSNYCVSIAASNTGVGGNRDLKRDFRGPSAKILCHLGQEAACQTRSGDEM